MSSSMKFLVTVALFFTASTGSALPAVETIITGSDVVPNASMIDCELLSHFDRTGTTFLQDLPHFQKHFGQFMKSLASTLSCPAVDSKSTMELDDFQATDTESSIMTTVDVAAPYEQQNTGRTAFASFTTPSIALHLETDDDVQLAAYAGQEPSRTKGFTGNRSILALYLDVFNEPLVATKKAAMGCFRMVRDLGERGLAVAKRGAMELFKFSNDLYRDAFSASNSVVEHYSWTKCFERISQQHSDSISGCVY